MAFFNRKKQVSFFLLIVLVSQVCFEESRATPIEETHKTSLSPAKIISPEIAIKPAGSLQDTISRFQYQLLFIGIKPISYATNVAMEVNQKSTLSSRLYNSKTFLFNRVLRI